MRLEPIDEQTTDQRFFAKFSMKDPILLGKTTRCSDS